MSFIKLSKLWLVLSSALIIFALFAMFSKGFNLGIDFTGGTSIVLRFNDSAVQLDKVRAATKIEKAEITMIDGKDFSFKTPTLTNDEKNKFLGELQAKFGGYILLEEDTIGASIGKKLQEESWLIVILALAGMLVYVTFRFQFWYGLAAVIALLHDAIITLGFVAWLQLDVNTALIAAVLTILGYSINDTIIVFDRVREDVVKEESKGKDIGQVVNTAILATFVRCINTVVTVIIACLALYFFGGVTIRQFAQILLIGFTIGAYSSLCVASPLYVYFRRNQG